MVDPKGKQIIGMPDAYYRKYYADPKLGDYDVGCPDTEEEFMDIARGLIVAAHGK